jgi:hypothetical protein
MPTTQTHTVPRRRAPDRRQLVDIQEFAAAAGVSTPEPSAAGSTPGSCPRGGFTAAACSASTSTTSTV